MKIADYYKKLNGKIVQCFLCPHNCVIKAELRGKCGIRENIDGTLYSLAFGKVIASDIEPVDKKTLFNFLPGTKTLSVSTVGCSMTCDVCQNWEISQSPKPQYRVIGQDKTPESLVQHALSNDCQSISYTYTEPTVFIEFAIDTANNAKKHGLKNIFLTNGFINQEPQDELCKVLDAVNVDLKGITEKYYRDYCGASLAPVIDAIWRYYENGIWVEITTLLVPGRNDNDEVLEEIAAFITSVDPVIPWHVSRFLPTYKARNLPVTDFEKIARAIEIGKEYGLKYIYAGNVSEDGYTNTCCPTCGTVVIARDGFMVKRLYVENGKCPRCKNKVDVIFSQDSDVRDSIKLPSMFRGKLI